MPATPESTPLGENFMSQIPSMKTAIGMTGVRGIQREEGWTGRGVKIGIVDSGVDYLHPAVKQPPAVNPTHHFFFKSSLL